MFVRIVLLTGNRSTLKLRNNIPQQLEFPLEQVNGLLPFKKVKLSETTKKKITNVHGSLKGTEVRKLIEQKEEDERKKEKKRRKR